MITGREGLLPFWVADMDFRMAPEIQEAVERRLSDGILGYTYRPESLDEAMVNWFSGNYGWDINRRDIVEVPGIVPAIHILIRLLTEPGEPVVIQEPVYYPFRTALESNARRPVVNHLVRDGKGRWRMDLNELERLLDESGARVLIFCSPHNPVGRVWEEAELRALARLCRDRGVTVVSDEIHADIVHRDIRYQPWLSLPEDELPGSLSLIAPTKSFNIPGLTTAYAVIPDLDFRTAVKKEAGSLGFNGSSSVLGYAAAEAAWRHGAPWLREMLAYLKSNDEFFKNFLQTELPGVSSSVLEGTYLEWMDCSRLDVTADEAWEKVLDAGAWLSPGGQFGEGGESFLRMNIACPRSQLEAGLECLAGALARGGAG